MHRRDVFAIMSFLIVLTLSSLSVADDVADEAGEEVVNEATGDQAVEVMAGETALVVPSTWQKEEPSSRMRSLQFRVPAVEGDAEDAELAVFNFGRLSGSVDENVQRWIAEFRAKGRTVEVHSGTGTDGEYVVANLSGIYKKPIGPPRLRKTKDTPGMRVLAVMLMVPKKGRVFLKLAGPDATVSAQESAIRAAIGANVEAEKEYSLGN